MTTSLQMHLLSHSQYDLELRREANEAIDEEEMDTVDYRSRTLSPGGASSPYEEEPSAQAVREDVATASLTTAEEEEPQTERKPKYSQREPLVPRHSSPPVFLRSVSSSGVLHRSVPTGLGSSAAAAYTGGTQPFNSRDALNHVEELLFEKIRKPELYHVLRVRCVSLCRCDHGGSCLCLHAVDLMVDVCR